MRSRKGIWESGYFYHKKKKNWWRREERKRLLAIYVSIKRRVEGTCNGSVNYKTREIFVKFVNLPNELKPEVYESIINPISYHMYLDLYHMCQ